MKISMDKKYRTRDGQEPRIICADAGGEYPVIGLIDDVLHRWTDDGWFYRNKIPGNLDLIEYHEPDIRTIWVNVYEDWTSRYDDEVEAKRNTASGVKSIAQPVTFEVKRS